ncbi:hypothetical protein Tco_0592835 [Tanacetum coccineum]
MIAFLEKTEGNVEFHEVIDFLRRSYVIMRSLLKKKVSDQAKEIKLLKAKITKLKKQAKPGAQRVCIQTREEESKRRIISSKRSLFECNAEDKINHMETENAQSEGRTREMVDEDKEFDEDRLSTEDGVSTDKEGVSTDFEKVSTDRPKVSTDGSKVSTDEQVEGTEEQREGTEDQTKEEITSKASQTSTQTPTSMIFGDDETIATLLLNMSQAKAASKEKEKGIDPKDKEKKKIKEEDESESKDDDIPQAVKKFKQLENERTG